MSSAVSGGVGKGATRVGLCVGLSMLVVGCRKPMPVHYGSYKRDRSPPPPVVPQGYALLSSGTPVYLTPEPGLPVTRVRPLGEKPDPWPSPGLAVKVVGEANGFIEVAPILFDTHRHCETPLAGGVIDLSWYVSPWSLASVLTSDYERVFNDDTRVSIKAGVPVRPAPEGLGRYTVATGGIRLALPLSRSDIGHSWQDLPTFHSMPDKGLELVPDMGLAIGSGPVNVLLPERVGQVAYTVTGSEMIDGEHMVDVVAPCIAVKALSGREPAPAKPPEPIEPTIEAGEIFGFVSAQTEGRQPVEDVPVQPRRVPVGEPPFFPVVEQGAAIYVDGAGPARGGLRDTRVFSEPSFVAGDRLCFTLSMSHYFDPPLPICFDSAEVRVSTPESKPFEGGFMRVEPVTLEVSENLEQAAVSQRLRQLRHELRTCYGRLVFDRLHSHATLDLMLSVDADGTVTQAHEFLEPELLNRGCYGTAAESWALPAPTDGQPGRVTLRVELTTRAWDHDLHH